MTTQLQVEINKVDAEKIRPLRHSELRKGQDYSTRNLMVESFKELKKSDCDMLWCNARLGAVNFYKSVGFKIIGELFDIEAIGPHYYMYKEI